MKLNEITGKPRAENETDLIRSINNGVFTKDGSKIKPDGNLSFSSSELTSLNGCPQIIQGSFNCCSNKLRSLQYGPTYVKDNFYCYENLLTSLEFCPQEVGLTFSCYKNKLTSLKDIHKYVKKIGGTFYAMHNPIKSHVLGLLKIEGCIAFEIDNLNVREIINKYLPLGDIFDCQEELIEAGLEEYAQL